MSWYERYYPMRLRGMTMAFACTGVIVGALGTMWAASRDIKEKEGVDSPYGHGALVHGGSDARMTSSDVAAVVSVPRPGKERIPHHRPDFDEPRAGKA